MNAKGPLGVHDAGRIAGVGDGVVGGGVVDVAAGVGRAVGEATGDGVGFEAGLATVVQPARARTAQISVESLDGMRLIWCVLLPVWWQRDVRVDRLLRVCRRADTRTVRGSRFANVSLRCRLPSLSATRHRERGGPTRATQPTETGRPHPGA